MQTYSLLIFDSWFFSIQTLKLYIQDSYEYNVVHFCIYPYECRPVISFRFLCWSPSYKVVAYHICRSGLFSPSLSRCKPVFFFLQNSLFSSYNLSSYCRYIKFIFYVQIIICSVWALTKRSSFDLDYTPRPLLQVETGWKVVLKSPLLVSQPLLRTKISGNLREAVPNSLAKLHKTMHCSVLSRLFLW